MYLLEICDLYVPSQGWDDWQLIYTWIYGEGWGFDLPWLVWTGYRQMSRDLNIRYTSVMEATHSWHFFVFGNGTRGRIYIWCLMSGDLVKWTAIYQFYVSSWALSGGRFHLLYQHRPMVLMLRKSKKNAGLIIYRPLIAKPFQVWLESKSVRNAIRRSYSGQQLLMILSTLTFYYKIWPG